MLSELVFGHVEQADYVDAGDWDPSSGGVFEAVGFALSSGAAVLGPVVAVSEVVSAVFDAFAWCASWLVALTHCSSPLLTMWYHILNVLAGFGGCQHSFQTSTLMHVMELL
jgi:hypothetical protein